MWCLARLLLLRIVEFIPEDDDQWKLYTTCLTIVDYVLAQTTNEDIIDSLSRLINYHHSRTLSSLSYNNKTVLHDSFS